MMEFIISSLILFACLITLSCIVVGVCAYWQHTQEHKAWVLAQEEMYERRMQYSEEAAELEHSAIRSASVDQLDREYLEAIKAMDIMAELEGDKDNDRR